MRWIERSVAFDVLVEILAGRCALTHEALDALASSQAVEHLRSALVVHGALPPRDEQLVRFTRWLDERTAKMAHTTGRQHLKAWAHWYLLNELNYRARQGTLTGKSVYTARGQVNQSIAFIEWLGSRGLELGDCKQHDVDKWFALGPTTRIRVSSFVKWAVKNGLIPKVTIPRAGQAQTYRCLDDAERRALIDRLVNETSLDVRDRFAGLLVLIYGQPITRIAQLRLSDVSVCERGVLLSLGDTPL